MVEVTLRFDYPWGNKDMDEDEIRECLEELSPEELICGALNEGNSINVEVFVKP